MKDWKDQKGILNFNYMPSPEFKKILEECKKIEEGKNFTRKQVVVYEQTIFKDLPQVCVKCSRKENLSLDHVIPKDLLQYFGIDYEREVVEGNYQILCKMCNNFKGNRLDFSTPKTKEVLLKLLEKI